MSSSHVLGVGTSKFGKQPNKSAVELGWEAIEEALQDAGTDTDAIDAVYVGTVFSEPGVAVRMLQGIGLTGIPIVTVENACASGSTAFHEGRVATSTGRYRRVLAVGVETMTAHFKNAIVPMHSDPEGRQGFAMPAIYAMAANRYQYEFGVTERQLAAVSVKNHSHGMLNERAQHRRELTIEAVLASRVISDPLTLFQCCSIADAAAAVVLGSEPTQHSVRVRSSVLGSGELWDATADRVWGWNLMHDTAHAAYEAAGLGPLDIDAFEVHDAFTIGEIVATEALGLCQLGEGGRLVESGYTALTGSQPVNPSGGLLSRGHPLGATGLAQVAEIVWQLRGDAGERQVPGARIGAVETMGGGAAGVDGNACVVSVLGN